MLHVWGGSEITRRRHYLDLIFTHFRIEKGEKVIEKIKTIQQRLHDFLYYAETKIKKCILIAEKNG